MAPQTEGIDHQSQEHESLPIAGDQLLQTSFNHPFQPTFATYPSSSYPPEAILQHLNNPTSHMTRYPHQSQVHQPQPNQSYSLFSANANPNAHLNNRPPNNQTNSSHQVLAQLQVETQPQVLTQPSKRASQPQVVTQHQVLKQSQVLTHPQMASQSQGLPVSFPPHQPPLYSAPNISNNRPPPVFTSASTIVGQGVLLAQTPVVRDLFSSVRSGVGNKVTSIGQTISGGETSRTRFPSTDVEPDGWRQPVVISQPTPNSRSGSMLHDTKGSWGVQEDVRQDWRETRAVPSVCDMMVGCVCCICWPVSLWAKFVVWLSTFGPASPKDVRALWCLESMADQLTTTALIIGVAHYVLLVGLVLLFIYL